MTMTIDVSHIDTCLACYLTDHHNRDCVHPVFASDEGAVDDSGRDLGLVCATCGHVIREPDDEEPDNELLISAADDAGLNFDALARIGRNWQD